MNKLRALLVCLSLFSGLIISSTNAYTSRSYDISCEVGPSRPSCSQCNKIIVGHNFCCNFNRFLHKNSWNYEKAFIQAAKKGYNEYLELLLELGVDVNYFDDADGKTALMYAAQHGHAQTCRLLLDYGAQIDARTNWGSTALMWAAEFGHSNVCQLLINEDAHINARTKSNFTAYTYAKRRGHPRVCTLLRDAGATQDFDNGSSLSIIDCVMAGLAGYGLYHLLND